MGPAVNVRISQNRYKRFRSNSYVYKHRLVFTREGTRSWYNGRSLYYLSRMRRLRHLVASDIAKRDSSNCIMSRPAGTNYPSSVERIAEADTFRGLQTKQPVQKHCTNLSTNIKAVLKIYLRI